VNGTAHIPVTFVGVGSTPQKWIGTLQKISKREPITETKIIVMGGAKQKN